MKGPFWILLVGGGLILILGLFSGKITFPGATLSTPTSADQTAGKVSGDIGATARTGLKKVLPSASNVYVDSNGNCPAGFKKTFDSSGLPYCVPG